MPPSPFLCLGKMFKINYGRTLNDLPVLVYDDGFELMPSLIGQSLRQVVETVDGLDLILYDDGQGRVHFFSENTKTGEYVGASREGCFNDAVTSIIEVTCRNHIQHYHLWFVIAKIIEWSQDIGFFKVSRFRVPSEIYFVPYESHTRETVLQQLNTVDSVNYVMEDLKSDGSIELLVSGVE